MPTQSMLRSHMSYYQLLYIAPLHSVFMYSINFTRSWNTKTHA